MRIRTLAPLVLLLAALGVGLVPTPLFGQSEPGTNDIIITSGNATPANLQIPVGSSVRWVNNDSIAHELVLEFSDGLVLPLLDLQPGADFTLAFSDAETVTFRSEDDPGVTGTIVVGSSTPAPTATSTTATATAVPPTATSTTAPQSTATTQPANSATATTAASTATPTTVPQTTATSPAGATATSTPTSPAGGSATSTVTTQPATTATATTSTGTPTVPGASPTSPPPSASETTSPSTPAPTTTPEASSTTEGSEAATSTPTAAAVSGTPIPTPPPPNAGGLGLAADGPSSGLLWLALVGAAVMAFAVSALFWSGAHQRITFERRDRKP